MTDEVKLRQFFVRSLERARAGHFRFVLVATIDEEGSIRADDFGKATDKEMKQAIREMANLCDHVPQEPMETPEHLVPMIDAPWDFSASDIGVALKSVVEQRDTAMSIIQDYEELTGSLRHRIDLFCVERKRVDACQHQHDKLLVALQQVLHDCRKNGRGADTANWRIIERCEDIAVAALKVAGVDPQEPVETPVSLDPMIRAPWCFASGDIGAAFQAVVAERDALAADNERLRSNLAQVVDALGMALDVYDGADLASHEPAKATYAIDYCRMIFQFHSKGAKLDAALEEQP